MQTFNLDLSKKGVIPLMYAKQRDVGTKILINITDNGKEYTIPEGASFSVWFSGKSGEGNYTTINGKSAFSITGNAVTVELIMQMLNNPGEHLMCLVMNGTGGSQLGLWNIPYYVEAIPGADSAAAQQYYQAFLQAQERAETAAQVAEDAQEHANAAAQTAVDAAARAEQVVASVDQVTLEQMRALVTEAENLSTEAVDAAARAGEDAARAERAAESVDKATLAQMQELIAGAEDLSVEAATAAERAEKAAEDAEDSAYNKQNKLAWATDEDIDAMFDGTYEGVENEDPEGDGYLPGGASGEPGADGKSAYEIAQEHGFEGTEEEWLASLKGETGDPGADGQPGKDGSPGKAGADGAPGADGYTPQKGVDYYTDADKEEMVEAVIEAQQKHYELIETINVSEDGISSVSRNTHPDGTPYNLSAAMVKAEFYYPMASRYGTRVDFKSNGSTIASVVLKLLQETSTNTAHASTAIYKMVPNKVVYDVVGAQAGRGGEMPLVYPPNGDFQLISTDTRIDGISYVLWDGNILPVGTKITIWGVRADA